MRINKWITRYINQKKLCELVRIYHKTKIYIYPILHKWDPLKAIAKLLFMNEYVDTIYDR